VFFALQTTKTVLCSEQKLLCGHLQTLDNSAPEFSPVWTSRTDGREKVKEHRYVLQKVVRVRDIVANDSETSIRHLSQQILCLCNITQAFASLFRSSANTS
jgi:hypothetical protein